MMHRNYEAEYRPNRQPLIGVTGRKRSGKNTISDIFTDWYDFKQLSFAARLKRILADVDPTIAPGVRLQQFLVDSDWETAKESDEIRRLLQTLGSAVREHLSEDAWIDPVVSEVQWRLAEGQGVIVSDVRYPNEADRIQSLGGIIVRMHRDPIGEDALSQHQSETAMDEYLADVDIQNTGSLENLRLAAADVMDRYIS